MSDKQREKHLADYWGGYLTRTEAQTVFDETAKVIKRQQQTLQQMDAVLSYFADKFEVKPTDIQEWINKKMEEATKAADSAAVLSGSPSPIEVENPGIKVGAAQFGGEPSHLVAA